MAVRAEDAYLDYPSCYLSGMQNPTNKMLIKHSPPWPNGRFPGQPGRPRVGLQRGFTLIELLVTISIAVIMMTLAVPSFMDFLTRNRLVTYNNDLVASLNFARSEAIRRGTTVSVCKSSTGASCTGTWSDGWIVFVNLDGATESPAVVDAGETVLRVHETLSKSDGYTLNGNTPYTNYVTFDADGSANTNGTFVFCRNSDTATARTAILTRLRIRTGVGAASCTNP